MSITGASTVFTLTVGPPFGMFGAQLFSAPQQLQGFAADDVFSIESVTASENMMGLDGVQVVGFVFVPVRQTIALQADSPSNFIFDIWWNTMQTSKITFYAQGIIVMPTIGTKWNLINGLLTQYVAMPSTKKLLQPRRYGVTWQQVNPAAFGGKFTTPPLTVPQVPRSVASVQSGGGIIELGQSVLGGGDVLG